MNTKVSYLYRDASNYKVHNECIIIGDISTEQIREIQKCLLDGIFFKPAMVGLPEKNFVSLGYKTCDDDPEFFEIGNEDDIDYSFETTDQTNDVDMTTLELVEKFKAASKNDWLEKRDEAEVQNRSMRIVLLEPGKIAEIKEIGTSLEEMQEVVGGYIQEVYPFPDPGIVLVCNDDGKLLGMPLNRALRHEKTKAVYDILAGPCFICGCGDCSFTGLTEGQAKKYAEMFKRPEHFFEVAGQIVAVPYYPEVSTS